MATTMETTSAGRAFPRLSWGAVIAGVLLALAAHVVLGLIGATLGFAAGAEGSRATGAAAAIWALVTPFVATLLGAWLACRMAASEDSRSASLHGVLVWCIGLIAGAIFLTGAAASPSATPMSPITTCAASASRTPAITAPQCSRGNSRPPAASVAVAM